MKDRNVQYPNRYRMQKVAGTDDIFDLIPAPGEVYEEGDLINKGLLLSDATAALYGLDSDAVPDDALKRLATGVGDIKVTKRTDLDDTWLLCNGDIVSATDFSELTALYPKLDSVFTTIDNLWGNNSYINAIAYADGYWVVGGRRFYSSGKACIAYTTSLDGTWTTKDIWSDDNSLRINTITYANGYWVVGGSGYSGRIYQASIAYATSLDGTWTTVHVWTGATAYEAPINTITYANGYWVVGGQRYMNSAYYARIAYATSLDGTWTTKDLWSDDGTSKGKTTINAITYTDGYWVAGGSCYIGDYHARIAYALSPEGTWTTKDLWSGGGESTSVINTITCANGYWVVGGIMYTGNYQARIAYATSLDGTWTTKDLWSSTNSYINLSTITYANGYWVVGGQYYMSSTYYARIAYATSPDGAWTTKDLWSDSGSGSSDMNPAIKTIIYANGYWVVGGGLYRNACMAYTSGKNFLLPTLSFDGAYVYIKAKER